MSMVNGRRSKERIGDSIFSSDQGNELGVDKAGDEVLSLTYSKIKSEDEIMDFLSANKVQGLFRLNDGSIFMATKSEGSRLEILEAARIEMLCDERKREKIVAGMLSSNTQIKKKGGLNYVG